MRSGGPMTVAVAVAVFVLGQAQAACHGQKAEGIRGARRFLEYCAGCHGSDGRGGAKGPSLVDAQTADLADNDLYRILQDGTRGGMPPFAQIGDSNIEALVHFLRLLSENGTANTASQAKTPTGDAQAGRALYFGSARCSECHMMNGQGGFIARSLTHYAKNRSNEAVLHAITDPDSPLARASRVVAVTTKDGQTITGVLRNEDNFDLALQSVDGRYHLLQRSNLLKEDYTDHSLMPRDYAARLSAKELNDLVTFLIMEGRAAHGTEAQDR